VSSHRPPHRPPTGPFQSSRQALAAARHLLSTEGLVELTRLAFAGVRTLGVRGLIRRAAAARRLREDDARYRQWVDARPARAAHLARLAGDVHALPSPPRISLLTPVFDTDAEWLRRCVESVRQQIYPAWELCLWDDGSTRAETKDALRALEGEGRIRIGRGEHRGIAAASNAALALATGDFVGFLDHDDELTPDALAAVGLVLAAQADLDVVYSDEDKTDGAGVLSHPHFKPDWSPELLRACMYTSHFTVMRRRLVLEIGGFRDGYDGAQDYDLMLRAAERTSRIAHIPEVLYHWRMAAGSGASSRLAKPWAISAGQRALEDHLRRTRLEATVQRSEAAGHYRVSYAVAGAPAVSVLLPWEEGDNRAVRDLSRLVRALRRPATIGSIELIVACHGGPPPPAWIRALDAIPHRVVEVPGDRPPTRAAALNRAAGHAAGAHLLTIDPRLDIPEGGWIDALVAFSQLDRVGAVGPVLLQADGTIDSAGIVIGCGAEGSAGAFHGEPRWTWGHVANALHTRECSAVDVACLMTSRGAFERAGGFDESLGGGLLAVDFGLRLREAGFRVLVTPDVHARWTAGRPAEPVDAGAANQAAGRWGRLLEADPYYNVNFDRAAASFRLPPV
jgi:GT2 family glycosyltransferase